MNRAGETSIDWVLQWILRGSMTLIVGIGIILIVGKFVNVETATENSQRALLVQKILHDDSMTMVDGTSGLRTIGTYDAAKLKDTKNTESALEENILYPKKWNSRAATVTVGTQKIRYRPLAWNELNAVKDYKGSGASSRFSASLIVSLNSEDQITTEEATIELLESHS